MQDPRPQRRWLWPALTAVTIVLAVWIPNDWFSPIKSAYGTSELLDPFSPEIIDLDNALLRGIPLSASLEVVQSRLPLVQARRLLSQGRVRSDNVSKLVSQLRESATRINASTGPTRDAEREHRDLQIQKSFPRLIPAKIGPTLNKVERDFVALVPTKAMSKNCESCHQASDSREGLKIDVEGLWPKIPVAALDGLPIRTEVLELAAYETDLGADDPRASCTDCHAPHGEPNFGVDLAQRREGMGLWIEVYRIKNALYVQTKVKNSGVKHRAPGGYVGRGYALVVEAFAGHERTREPLPFFYGEALPAHLRGGSAQAGTMFWRKLVRPNGRVTSDHREAVNIVDDSRLLGQRFVDNRFIFTLPESNGQTPYYVVVRLVYLPDVMTWEGSEDVEVRVFKTG